MLMRNLFINIVQLLVFSSILLNAAYAQVKVVGYLPSYKGLGQHIDTIDLSKITHLNIAFVNPTKNNAIVKNKQLACMNGPFNKPVEVVELKATVKKAHQAGVKILTSLGGAAIPSCGGNWEVLLQENNRDKLVKSLMQFVDDFAIDGVDIDLEGVLLTRIDNAGNFTPFIKSLSQALKQRNKLLTAATASYEGGMVPIKSLPFFDFVTIMSYDAIGPNWGPAGVEHSTYLAAKQHMALWQERGLSKDKLVLGLPFYGYGFGDYDKNYAYKDIVAQFGVQQVEADIIGKACAHCDYITFNGIKTIEAKTQLALEQGSGVMIWELSHDAKGNNSLLRAVNRAIKNHQN
jgi:GH18 family chitinase